MYMRERERERERKEEREREYYYNFHSIIGHMCAHSIVVVVVDGGGCVCG